MKIQVTQTLPNGQVLQQVLSKEGGEALKVQVQPGAKVSFNMEGSKPTEGGNAKAKTGSVKKVGNNLVLEAEGEALVEVTDFYSTPGASVGDLGWNYVASDAAVTAATPEAQALAADAAATESGALLPAIAPGWLAVGGAAAVAAAGSNGGSDAAKVVGAVLVIGLALGPLTDAGSGTTVKVYKANGTELAGSGTWVDGKFVFTPTEAYSGKVFIRVIDGDAADDYRDEATGLAKNMGSDLWAATEVGSGASSVPITVTPITTIAALKAVGATSVTDMTQKVTSGNGANADITNTNKAIATLFGLSTSEDLAQQTPEMAITSGGTSSTPNTYGKALAVISKVDVTTGSFAQTIDQLVAATTVTGATASFVGSSVVTALAAAATSTTVAGVAVSSSEIQASTAPVSDPVFTSAAVNAAGTTVTLTYGEALDGTKVPVANDFVVNVGGVARAVSSVSVSGSTVVLTLASAVYASEVVTVGYTDPTAGNDTNAIQDTAGNDAATIAAQSVTNSSIVTVPDTTAPVFTSAAVNAAGTTVTLTYGEALDGTNVPVANDFVVNVGGVARAVSSVSVSGSTVVLTLASAVYASEVVTVGYTDPTAGNDTNAIQDTAGNDAATIAAQSVTNSSTVAVPDTTAPTVTITDNKSVTTNGDVTFTFTFSEAVTGFVADKISLSTGTKGTFTAVSSTVYTLVVTPPASGSGNIEVTTSTTGVTDAAGNAATAPSAYTQAYDTLAPTASLGNTGAGGVINATEATDAAGVTSVTAESGAAWTVTFTGTSGTVTKTGTGNGSAQAVALVAGDITTLGQGAVSVSVSATDAAGNAVTTSTGGNFVLDTLAPTASLGNTGAGGVINATEATDAAGVTSVTAESGAAWTVTFTGTSGTVTKTGTGNGSAQAVALVAGDITTLGQGAVSVSVSATDAAGNAVTTSTGGNFVLDTVPPAILYDAHTLDGTNTVKVTTSPTGDQSYSMWVKPTSAGAGLNPRILTLADNSGASEVLSILYDGVTKQFALYAPNLGIPFDNAAKSNAVLEFNQWTHLALTVDGSSQVKLYADGELVLTAQMSGPVSPTSVNFGGDLLGTERINGDIADLRVSDALWTAADIANKASKGIAVGNEKEWVLSPLVSNLGGLSNTGSSNGGVSTGVGSAAIARKAGVVAVSEDLDHSNNYSSGDTLTIKFADAVSSSALELSDLQVSNGHGLGTGASLVPVDPVDGMATTFKVILGTGASVTPSDVITIAAANLADVAGNPVGVDVTFVVPQVDIVRPMQSVMTSNGFAHPKVSTTVSGDQSYSMWLNLTNSAGSNPRLLTLVDSSNSSLLEVLYDTATKQIGLNGSFGYLKSLATIEIGQWMHVTATIDASGLVTLLVNGEVVLEANLGSALAPAAVYFGSDSNSNERVAAQMTDLRVFDASLSGSDVQTKIMKGLQTGTEAEWLLSPLSNGANALTNTAGSGTINVVGAEPSSLTFASQVIVRANADDYDGNGSYSEGDVIRIEFNESVSSSLTITDLILSNGTTFGTGATLTPISEENGRATGFLLTLGSSPTVVAGNSMIIDNSKLSDAVGNAPTANAVFVVPVADHIAPGTPTATLNGFRVIKVATSVTDDFSAASWFNVTDKGGDNPRLISFRNSTGDLIFEVLYDTSTKQIGVYGPTLNIGWDSSTKSAATLEFNQPTHIGVTVDSNKLLKLWINGESKLEIQLDSNAVISPAHIFYGGNPDLTEKIAGSVGDIRVADVAWSAQDIAKVMAGKTVGNETEWALNPNKPSGYLGNTGSETAHAVVAADGSGNPATVPITVKMWARSSSVDQDSSTGYTGGDTITLSFNDSVDVDLSINDLILGGGHNFGTGATLSAISAINGRATQFVVTLGSDSTVTSGDSVSINKSLLADSSGNIPTTDATFSIPPIGYQPSVPPIALDFNRDGQIDYVTDKSQDMTGDGTADTTAWVGNFDAVLFADKNIDGVANAGEWAFGDLSKGLTDLQGLALLDDNADGLINLSDSVWSSLKVWQDTNGDGMSTGNEVLSLAQVGIASIELKRNDQAAHKPVEGVQVYGSAWANMVDGSQMLIHDAAFAYTQQQPVL